MSQLKFAGKTRSTPESMAAEKQSEMSARHQQRTNLNSVASRRNVRRLAQILIAQTIVATLLFNQINASPVPEPTAVTATANATTTTTTSATSTPTTPTPATDAPTVTNTTATTTAAAAPAATTNPPAGPPTTGAPATETPTTAASSPSPIATTPAPATSAVPATTSPPVPSATSAKPTYPTDEKEIEAAKLAIKKVIAVGPVESRIIMNRPTLAPQSVDFAADSPEARLADSTTQFGLNFINNLQADAKENVVISPLSLQNLLNMVLLGASDKSATQRELTQTLGYDLTQLLNTANPDERLRPHEAMRSLLENIMAATHLSVSAAPSSELLNTNAGALQPASEQPTGQVEAHLQTLDRPDGIPLSGQVNFTLANLVLTNKDAIALKGDYERELKSFYNVNVEEFSRKQGADSISPNKSSGAGATTAPKLPLHEQVNSWVRNKTQNQIEKLANEADLSGDNLIMVLLNAAHFKGRWLHTFNAKATTEKSFFNYGDERAASRVKFMRQKGVFAYADFGSAGPQAPDSSESRTSTSDDDETLLTEDASKPTGDNSQPASGQNQTSLQAPIIELSKKEARKNELTARLNCSALMLPFSLNDGQELSMVLLLPAKRDGINELIGALNGPTLNEVYRSLSEQQVQVEIPKFSFEGAHDAKSALLRMGLKSIFVDSADLHRMYEVHEGFKQPVKVDKIIHKAKISVDESGAEAAAASMASIVSRNFIMMPTPTFLADHPFLFIIRHNRSNMPLFMGRVSSL